MKGVNISNQAERIVMFFIFLMESISNHKTFDQQCFWMKLVEHFRFWQGDKYVKVTYLRLLSLDGFDQACLVLFKFSQD